MQTCGENKYANMADGTALAGLFTVHAKLRWRVNTL